MNVIHDVDRGKAMFSLMESKSLRPMIEENLPSNMEFMLPQMDQLTTWKEVKIFKKLSYFS